MATATQKYNVGDREWTRSRAQTATDANLPSDAHSARLSVAPWINMPAMSVVENLVVTLYSDRAYLNTTRCRQ